MSELCSLNIHVLFLLLHYKDTTHSAMPQMFLHYLYLLNISLQNSVTQPNESTPPRHTDNSELVVKNMF